MDSPVFGAAADSEVRIFGRMEELTEAVQRTLLVDGCFDACHCGGS